MVSYHSQAKQRPFSLTTINFHGYQTNTLPRFSKRCVILDKTLAHNKSTVICLQEIHTYTQLHTLTKKLKYPHVAYMPSLRGPAGGLVILSKKPINKCIFLPFPRLSNSEQSRYTVKSRVFTGRKGILITEINNYRIYNVHLAPNKDADWSPTNRFTTIQLSQLNLLATSIKARKVKPTFIAGDFNIPGDSDIFQNFLEDNFLEDCEKNIKTPTFKQEHLRRGSQARRVDMVLFAHTSRDDIVAKRLDEQMPISDHYGIRIVYSPNRNMQLISSRKTNTK